SLACSTIGSHRRQLGGHGEARRWDSTALKLAAQVDADEAMADALLGLAADALAVGRLAESTSLVSRAESRARSQWRTEIRHGWVTAELALASGRAADAVAPAEAAARLSREQDRKSTRLNSSHVKISYAVFCLKKKKEDAR